MNTSWLPINNPGPVMIVEMTWPWEGLRPADLSRRRGGVSGDMTSTGMRVATKMPWDKSQSFQFEVWPMWIFTKHGFFSAVCAREGDGSHGRPVDPDRIMVRG